MSNVIPFPDIFFNKAIKQAKQDVIDEVAELIADNRKHLKKIVAELSYIGRESAEFITIINTAGDRYLLKIQFEPA